VCVWEGAVRTTRVKLLPALGITPGSSQSVAQVTKGS